MILLSLLLPAVAGVAADVLEVGKFSAATEGNGLPAGWKPLTFKKIARHTEYRLVKDGGAVVVQARSDAASAGLTREIRIDPKIYPVVQWRWKVANVYEKGDVSRKDGDDYPARLYVTFAYDQARLGLFDRAKYEAARLFYGQYPPLGAINYIWESKAPKGTMVANPYTDRVMMVVVESGTERLNRWVTEERNILEDYRKAFGEEPSMISGVAIMTDSDNTGEAAIAWYGDIRFKPAS